MLSVHIKPAVPGLEADLSGVSLHMGPLLFGERDIPTFDSHPPS